MDFVSICTILGCLGTWTGVFVAICAIFNSNKK